MEKKKPGFFRFNRRNRWLFYIILMAMAALFSLQQNKDNAGEVQTVDQPVEVIAISAEALSQSFSDDPQDALQRFHKKQLRVFGTVLEPGTAQGKVYVKFATRENACLVRYYAGKDMAEWAKALKPEEKISVTGVCQDFYSNVVVLE